MYPEKQEVDHTELIARLNDDFPDGWALSLHTPSLQYILSLCPTDVRIMAWVKPFAVFKPGVGLAYAWEPVIIRGGRKRSREQPTVRDWLAESITMKKGLVGAKPEKFAYWLFEAMNMQPDDEFVDIFPGTGIMTKCWNDFKLRDMPLQLKCLEV
jgi:hypothetical protein